MRMKWLTLCFLLPVFAAGCGGSLPTTPPVQKKAPIDTDQTKDQQTKKKPGTEWVE
jgi:predicted small lipoprotein YifL